MTTNDEQPQPEDSTIPRWFHEFALRNAGDHAQLGSENAATRQELSAANAATREELLAANAALREELARLESRLTRWIVAGFAVVIAANAIF